MRGRTTSRPGIAPSSTPVPWGAMHASSACMTGPWGQNPTGVGHTRKLCQGSSLEHAFPTYAKGKILHAAGTDIQSLERAHVFLSPPGAPHMHAPRPTFACVVPCLCTRHAPPHTWARRGHHAPIIRGPVLLLHSVLPCALNSRPLLHMRVAMACSNIQSSMPIKATPSTRGWWQGSRRSSPCSRDILPHPIMSTSSLTCFRLPTSLYLIPYLALLLNTERLPSP